MTRVLIVSGGGDYTDPWHPFAETTARLRGILAPDYDVTVTDEVAATLSELGRGDADLVVLNLGSGGEALPTDVACVAGLARYTQSGGALLVNHQTATAFPEVPQWEGILGGRWVRGTSMHPPRGAAAIDVVGIDHPVTRGVNDFSLTDERYSYLRIAADVDILAAHEHDGLQHPLVWAAEREGARVVYAGLGHDGGAYESEEHRRLIRNAAAWLTRADAIGSPRDQ